MRDGMTVTVASPPVPQRGRHGWRAVGALGIGAFAIGTDMFVVAGILGGIARDLEVTVGTAGLTVTMFAMAYATGAVLLSALLGARPLRRVLIGSMALFAVLSVLTAMAPTFQVLLALRVLGALASSVYVPAAGAAAVAAVPADRRGGDADAADLLQQVHVPLHLFQTRLAGVLVIDDPLREADGALDGQAGVGDPLADIGERTARLLVRLNVADPGFDAVVAGPGREIDLLGEREFLPADGAGVEAVARAKVARGRLARAGRCRTQQPRRGDTNAGGQQITSVH